jgi:hypothetical protein
VYYYRIEELKKARWLSKSLYHIWRRSPSTIAYLQFEADALALQIGDYLEALNIAFRRFAKRHYIFDPLFTYDFKKLFDTLRVPPEPKAPGPVANVCINILTPDMSGAVAYYVAAKRLGLEVNYESYSLLTRIYGPAEGCTGPQINVATADVKNADLVLRHGRGGYVVRSEHTAYIFNLLSSNIPVEVDYIAHGLFLHPPFPCCPEDNYQVNTNLLPGTSDRSILISRDSLLIPSYGSGKVLHWWLPRELTKCEKLQAMGFSYEEAKHLSKYVRNIDVDPMTAVAQILTFLRVKGISEDRGTVDNYTV